MANGGRSGGRRANPAGENRLARVGEQIRRIVAEEIDAFDDDRLMMVSITGAQVDRELHRAVVWFTTLDPDDDSDAREALDEYTSRLRRAVSTQARLRHTPQLEFRPDAALRSAERIEELLREDARPPVPDVDSNDDRDGED